MVKKELLCTSCKTKIANLPGSIMFKCPGCEKRDIIRCKHCRELSSRYTCQCGFTGPN